MKVAFVGLGVMGFPMAGHLAAKGHILPLGEEARAWLVGNYGAGESWAGAAHVGRWAFIRLYRRYIQQ